MVETGTQGFLYSWLKESHAFEYTDLLVARLSKFPMATMQYQSSKMVATVSGDAMQLLLRFPGEEVIYKV